MQILQETKQNTFYSCNACITYYKLFEQNGGTFGINEKNDFSILYGFGLCLRIWKGIEYLDATKL